MKVGFIFSVSRVIMCSISMILVMTSCYEDPVEEIFFEEEELQISTYLEEHDDVYSSLLRVLEITGLKSTLNAYGHYTFFAPDNEAFDTFLEEQGMADLGEFEPDYLDNLVKYHLLGIEIESAYFRAGVIQDTTYSGDHLVVTFSEGGLETIMVNEGMISERDHHLENGILHKINHVLTPVTGSVADRLEQEGSYSIFSDALEMSGLKDTLAKITIKLNEEIHFRSRFTLFIENDETYTESGIHSVQDLIDQYSDTGDPADKDDGFYKYVAYHVIPGLYFLNDLDSFNYETLDENMLVNVSLGEEILLNRETRVIASESNQLAKNGAIHTVDRIMEPDEPDPVQMVFDLTNYQGISIGQEYEEKELEVIPGILAENTGIWFRNSILADGETNIQTTSNRVGWEVEFSLPPVIRGQYDVYFHWASHDMNCSWAQAFWDGARLGSTFSFRHQQRWPGVEWKRDYNTSEYLGRILLTETEPHTLRFTSLLEGYGNFDYLVLTPVEE